MFLFSVRPEGFGHLQRNTNPDRRLVSDLKSPQVTWPVLEMLSLCLPLFLFHTHAKLLLAEEECWKELFPFLGFWFLLSRGYDVSILMIRQTGSRVSTRCCKFSDLFGDRKTLQGFKHKIPQCPQGPRTETETAQRKISRNQSCHNVTTNTDYIIIISPSAYNCFYKVPSEKWCCR